MTLQQEASNMLYELPDDTISLIMELIRRMHPNLKTESDNKGLIFGLAKGKFSIDDEKFDAADAEIARLFGAAV